MYTTHSFHYSMLQEDRLSHLAQLSTLTTAIEQLEQFIPKSISSSIARQSLCQCLTQMSNNVAEVVDKLAKLQEKQAELKRVAVEQQKSLMVLSRAQKRKADEQGRVEQFIKRQFKILNKIMHYAEGCGLKAVTEGYLDKYLKKIISTGASFEAAKQLSEFLRFLKEYHSESIHHRFFAMVTDLQDGIHSYLSQAMRQIQSDKRDIKSMFSDESEDHTMDGLSRLSGDKMDCKIDIQILNNQIIDILTQNIGFVSSCPNSLPNWMQQLQCEPKQKIGQLILQKIIDMAVKVERKMQNQAQNSLTHLSMEIKKYVAHVQRSYKKECRSKDSVQSCKQLQNLICCLIKKALKSHCQSLIEQRSLKDRLNLIQERLSQLDEEIAKLKNKKVQTRSKSGWVNKDTDVALPLSNKIFERNQPNSQRSISISVSYRNKSMRFKVIRTINIGSNTQSNSYRQTSLYAKEQECFRVRILAFGKQKLILKGENPHFHEEIEIKRITKIKVHHMNAAILYFKKGSMLIQFVEQVHSAREWIRCFRAAYYDQQCLSGVQFVHEDPQRLSEKSTTKTIRSVHNRGRKSTLKLDKQNSESQVTCASSKMQLNSHF